MHGCDFSQDINELEIKNYFEQIKFLEAINFSFVDFHPKVFTEICKGLKNSCLTLFKINVSYCDLKSEICNIFQDFLSTLRYLKYFLFKGNSIAKGEGFRLICEGLQNSAAALTVLNFYNCNLHKDECKALCGVLEKCSSLVDVDFSCNKNTNEGFFDICSGLKVSAHCLLNLNFSSCNLKEKNSNRLALLLKSCTSIQHLDLSFNQNFGESCKIFEELINSKKSLAKLNLYGCSLTQKQISILNNFVKECSSIQEIIIGQNYEKKLVNNSFGNLVKEDFLNSDRHVDIGQICIICTRYWLEKISENFEHEHTLCIPCLKTLNFDATLVLLTKTSHAYRIKHNLFSFYKYDHSIFNFDPKKLKKVCHLCCLNIENYPERLSRENSLFEEKNGLLEPVSKTKEVKVDKDQSLKVNRVQSGTTKN